MKIFITYETATSILVFEHVSICASSRRSSTHEVVYDSHRESYFDKADHDWERRYGTAVKLMLAAGYIRIDDKNEAYFTYWFKVFLGTSIDFNYYYKLLNNA